MKLNKAQIEQLKKLISYKGYPEIDVQYEILDHVACKVEVLMEENPKLSLPDAFQKVHASFGVFGFSTLEESYKKMIEKRLWGYYWNELKQLFTSYRIIFPLGLLVIFFQSSTLLGDSKSWILMMIGFLFFSFIWIVIRYWHTYKKYKKYASFMASNSVFQMTNFGVIMCLYGHNFVYRQGGVQEGLFAKIFIGAILTAIAFLFISIFILPRVLDRSIADTEALIQVYGNEGTVS
ncbi:hypothetical protein [Cecembia lonarensis]|uniref:Uncharacterized protein n=1 Tax=Cecembia lonarensis (strain CCUG 58316 / KCTC 22772 / LW9) TaxID=1225176 RepID=K1LHD1_CECL9|nr:hypothetical protein [Cecembia lonarensis]EKB49653.1 hypothetical protein B879_01766 [Cecembia lonarensis LW9]